MDHTESCQDSDSTISLPDLVECSDFESKCKDTGTSATNSGGDDLLQKEKPTAQDGNTKNIFNMIENGILIMGGGRVKSLGSECFRTK